MIAHQRIGQLGERGPANRGAAGEGRVKPRRPREGALMKSTYVRVAIVWVMTLAALYAFQSYFTR